MFNPSFLFYDYETFGTDPIKDKVSQFACIRTDIEFNIISDPIFYYCKLPLDYLPDPNSIIITRITPQYVQRYGFIESEFAKLIYDIFNKPNTCILGYNNINFDDEFTRNIFYRNFLDPYSWSWKNGNSRWDVLNLLRACHALRPYDGLIRWPVNKYGHVSFKLEDITNINNIPHLNSHNAISDVYATLKLAKLIKINYNKLFLFLFKNRRKNSFLNILNSNKKILVYVSNCFGAKKNNIGIVSPLIWHPKNANILVTCNLLEDLNHLSKINFNILNKYKIKDIFNKRFKYYLPINFVYINKCPVILSLNCLRSDDLLRLNINLEFIFNNISILKKNSFFIKKIYNFFSQINNSLVYSDVESQLYKNFFSTRDKCIINHIRQSNCFKLSKINLSKCNFDERLTLLLFFYRSRNFENTLDIEEKNNWILHCKNKLNKNYFKLYREHLFFLSKKYMLDFNIIRIIKNIEDYSNYVYKIIFHKI
ncbi:exodeoxyribonuclease I [Buchnera aphidicola (Neophyllaphis varicolor)]|uniref:exodeoxyribonuclease I n=1 Tax=Buchnera aphidicola TaxID=9 RepID=UPI0031B8741E